MLIVLKSLFSPLASTRGTRTSTKAICHIHIRIICRHLTLTVNVTELNKREHCVSFKTKKFVERQ